MSRFGNKEININAYVCCKMLAMLYLNQWQYAAIKKKQLKMTL